MSRSALSTAVPPTVLDAVGQLGGLVVDQAVLGHQRADLAVGVHDGRPEGVELLLCRLLVRHELDVVD